MISLILLPLLCMYYLISINAFKIYSTVDLFVWDGKENSKNMTLELNDFLNSKTYKIIQFTGNKTDEIKLYEARKMVKNLIKSEDSLSGIKFHFSKTSTYNTFVETLNLLIEEGANVWVPYKNDILVVNPKKRKTKLTDVKLSTWTCGGSYYHFTSSDENEINWAGHWRTLKKFSIPVILFIFMIYFSFKTKLKSNR